MNVKIIVTHKRMRRMLSTSIFVDSSEVTKSGKLKNQSKLNKVNSIIAEYSRRISEMGLEFEDRTIDYIVDHLKKDNTTDFFKYVEIAMADIRTKSTKKVYSECTRLVREFIERDSLDFREMSLQFFKSFEKYLTKRMGGFTGGAYLYLGVLKTIYHRAMVYYNSEGEELIPHYPLFAYKVPSRPATAKRALPIERIREFMRADLCKSESYVRDVYMLSFCLMGMNLIDLFNCEYTSDDVICYNRTKTKARRDDGAYMEIVIDDRVKPLVQKYRGKKKMFCFSERHNNYEAFRCMVCNTLRLRIPKTLGWEPFTFYSARHSFATIAYNDCGLDKYVVHSMLNHVSNDMRITDVYIRRSFDRENEANKRILDLLFEE